MWSKVEQDFVTLLREVRHRLGYENKTAFCFAFLSPCTALPRTKNTSQ